MRESEVKKGKNGEAQAQVHFFFVLQSASIYSRLRGLIRFRTPRLVSIRSKQWDYRKCFVRY